MFYLTRRWMGAFAVVGALVTGCSSTETGFVAANGHNLFYSCGGSGHAVAFLAGLGGDHSLWPIADRLRDRVYACNYDRFGDGDSSPLASNTTIVDDAADLSPLLDGVRAARPVVLVGHSYGGLLAYVYARQHPEQVDGLLLIDPSHPLEDDRFREALSAEQWAAFIGAPPEGPHPDFDASVDLSKESYGPLGDLPITVLTASESFLRGRDCAALPCAELQAVSQRLHEDYASLSTDSRHLDVVASHHIQSDEPDLVVNEIIALLDRL